LCPAAQTYIVQIKNWDGPAREETSCPLVLLKILVVLQRPVAWKHREDYRNGRKVVSFCEFRKLIGCGAARIAACIVLDGESFVCLVDSE